jgi:hypothetical protein
MQKYSEAKKPLNKPFRTSGGPKKFAVYVKDPESGNVKIVRFGDPNMEIKRDDPDRKKSFRTRHNCDQKKDKTTAGYWSCKMWSKTPVGSITKSSNMTPFALLEKSAAFPTGAILGALKSFGKGLARAPGDLFDGGAGMGRGQFFSNLAERGAALRGNTAAEIGNLTGHMGIAGSGIYAVDKALGGEAARAELRKKLMEQLDGAGSTWRDHRDPGRNPNGRSGIRLGPGGVHPDWRPELIQAQRSKSEF